MDTKKSTSDVEQAWTIIATHMVENVSSTARNCESQKHNLISIIKESLRRKERLIASILERSVDAESISKVKTCLENIDNNQDRHFEKVKNSSARETESTASDSPSTIKCLTCGQVEEVKREMGMFKFAWKASYLQDHLVQEALLSEDGLNSIADKNSENDQQLAIFHFILGLSATDVFTKLIPILEDTGHSELATLLEKIQKVRENETHLSVVEILNMINPRRIANSLFQRGFIQVSTHRDLCSSCITKELKIEILQKVKWEDFLEALKEKYPHFHDVCLKSRSEGGEMVNYQIYGEPEDISDVANLPDSLNKPKCLKNNTDPDFCNCGHCRGMTNPEDNICCSKIAGVDCFGYGKEIDALIDLSRGLFKVMRTAKTSNLVARRQLHRQIRQLLYRQVSILLCGRTGPRIRHRIPSCYVWRIRKAFPDPYNYYIGFRDSPVLKYQ